MADLEAATGGTDVKVYERLSSWSAHVHFWTRNASPSLHVLRYEDLAAASGPGFAALLRFLGVEPEPARLARAIRFSDFATLHRQELPPASSERPPEATAPFFRVGRPGQWRAALSAAQRARIEHDHAAVMRRFGYL